MSDIYVVFGTTGEYSDRSEWPVAAFSTQEAADARVADCLAWARFWEIDAPTLNTNHSIFISDSKWGQMGYGNEPKCPHDDSFSYVSYTGVDWYVVKVPFVG